MAVQGDLPVPAADAGPRPAGLVEPWQAGWCPWARRVESPNFGERPIDCDIDLVIVHSISLPPGIYGGDEVEALFTNRLNWDAHPFFAQIRGLEVSAHFYVRRCGAVVQFVSCERRAWHAGASCWLGRENCNDVSIGIELEGLEGQAFEPAQYAVLSQLLRELAGAYPLRWVVGHEHVAPGRKQDPGPGFDWKRVSADVVPLGLRTPFADHP